jgi:broad specificity phosphatase PhoE
MSKPIHIGPDMSVHHPEYGDMTAEVARELQILNQQENDAIFMAAQQRQNHIAKVCGRESVAVGGLRHIAQIDEHVYNSWEAREGPEFWKHELDYMIKRHPELAVKSVSATPTFSMAGCGVKGKRGRWAL